MQGAVLVGVSDQIVELALVNHKPSAHSLTIGLGPLCELANDGAGLITVIWEPHLGLFLEGNYGLSYSEGLQETRFSHVGKEGCWGPGFFCEMLPRPGRDDRVDIFAESEAGDLGEARANVTGQSTIDGHAGHAVGRMAKFLEPWLGLAHALEACRVAGLHVDADDFPYVVIHRVPETTMSTVTHVYSWRHRQAR